MTFQGKPLAGAIVVFHPTASNGIGASALTNDDGKFELKTFPPDLGAVPGSYSVSILKTELPAQPPRGGDPNDPGPVRVVSAIPPKYSLPDKSGLHSEIPAAGTDSLRFELQN